MHIIDKLKSKNMSVIKMPKKGNYLRNKWVRNFANHLSEREKEDIYLVDSNGLVGYLWHLFSFNKKDYLEGEKAEQAFNNERKGKCYVFFQHSKYALLLEDASMLHTNDLTVEGHTDIYIVDENYNWTFVITHENGWLGPYFSRREEI